MQAAPVILRELGEQARRPSLVLLRVLSPLLLLAGALHLVLHPVYLGGWVVAGGRTFRAEEDWRAAAAAAVTSFDGQGSSLFASLNLVLLAAIWMFGPLVTADCLSRERREGTLGLLLLTPLKARDVVQAKWIAHALRVGVALASTIPVLLIPILLGGVSTNQVLRALLLDGASLALALSAGLYASIRWQGPRAVHAGALLIAAAAAFAWLVGWSAVEALLNLEPQNLLSAPTWIANRAVERFGRGLGVVLGLFVDPREFLWLANSSPISASPDLFIPAVLGMVAWIISRITLRAAARAVERVVATEDSRRTPTALELRLTRPSLLPQLLRRLQQAAEIISPVLALETRTWRLRIAPWLAVAAVGCAEAAWLGSPYSLTPLPVMALCAVIGMSAAAGLQRDRSSGVLELLLTAPRGTREVVVGKLAALVVLALPASLFVLGMEWIIELAFRPTGPAAIPRVIWTLISLASLTASCGLYFSLRLPNFALSALATVLTMVVVHGVALACATLLGFLADHSAPMTGFAGLPGSWVYVGLIELAIAAWFVFRLERRLRNGSFSARQT